MASYWVAHCVPWVRDCAAGASCVVSVGVASGCSYFVRVCFVRGVVIMACSSCNALYGRLASRSASGVLYDPWASEYREAVQRCGCESAAPCPVCCDIMTSHDNYRPTWSDIHDDIVCWWCAHHPGGGAS